MTRSGGNIPLDIDLNLPCFESDDEVIGSPFSHREYDQNEFGSESNGTNGDGMPESSSGGQRQMAPMDMSLLDLLPRMYFDIEEILSDNSSQDFPMDWLDETDFQFDVTDLPNQENEGIVSLGLDEDTIARYLKQGKYTIEGPSEVESCCICQEETVEGEDLGMLDCGHNYHTNCIKRWLQVKNECPVCKAVALNIEEIED